MKKKIKEATLGHIVQSFRKMGGDTAGQESPFTQDNIDEANVAECDSLSQARMQLKQTMASRQSPVAEDDMAQDAELGAQAQTGGTLGSAGAGGMGGGQYAPGTAPTMPESVQEGNETTTKRETTMENMDKDVSMWMERFKAYDELRASKAPVMETEEVAEAGPDKKDVPAFLRKEKGGDWKTSLADLEKEKDSKLSDVKTLAKNSGKKVDEATQPDAETLDWMARFSKLGNMKGYGR